MKQTIKRFRDRIRELDKIERSNYSYTPKVEFNIGNGTIEAESSSIVEDCCVEGTLIVGPGSVVRSVVVGKGRRVVIGSNCLVDDCCFQGAPHSDFRVEIGDHAFLTGVIVYANASLVIKQNCGMHYCCIRRHLSLGNNCLLLNFLSMSYDGYAGQDGYISIGDDSILVFSALGGSKIKAKERLTVTSRRAISNKLPDGAVHYCYQNPGGLISTDDLVPVADTERNATYWRSHICIRGSLIVDNILDEEVACIGAMEVDAQKAMTIGAGAVLITQNGRYDMSDSAPSLRCSKLVVKPGATVVIGKSRRSSFNCCLYSKVCVGVNSTVYWSGLLQNASGFRADSVIVENNTGSWL